MLEITASIQIPDDELEWSFVRASGPGGQNVNKVASKAVLRWNVARSAALSETVKARLRAQQGRRVTSGGDLILTSQRFRDQERNRQDCLGKLSSIVLQAATPAKPRRPTRPTRAAREAKLESKRRRARTKAGRRPPSEE
jgi:ribosome-associated protein